MSDDESFFDNVWEAGGNLVDAAVETAEGVGHVGELAYHTGGAVWNAATGIDAEDRQEMNDYYDASQEDAVEARESFGNAWDEIF